MSDTKNNVSIYNEYLKSINDVKRKVRNAQNIKRKALKKDINASEEDIKLIDLVIELLDARIPLSSRNPDIDDLGKNKARLVLLNK